MIWVLTSLAFIGLLEFLLTLTIRHFRKEFQWLITAQDEYPQLDPKALQKFINTSYDPMLGWVRKPNTSGTERSGNHQTHYTIDALGSRTFPHEFKTATIATFGDSYTFCRQVNDSDTWQAQLGRRVRNKVLNFGVGNYGIDQALLRYENTELPATVKYVVLGFVPETICRIHSYWKHYHEFGNTFAFKPRFELHNSNLKLYPNLMDAPEKFDALPQMLPQIQAHDFFYRSKFRKLQFRFPYLYRFVRNLNRNVGLLYKLTRRKVANKFHSMTPEIDHAPFDLIMRSNIALSHKMYGQEKHTDLLKAILLRFKETAQKRGHIPIVLVMPQLNDLKMSPKGDLPYAFFFKTLQKDLSVLDLTNHLMQQNDVAGLYTEDVYGGHLSPKGNKLVSDNLYNYCKPLVESATINSQSD